MVPPFAREGRPLRGNGPSKPQPSTSPSTNVAARAASAVASLQQLARELATDDTLTPAELAHVRKTKRIPLRALAIAADGSPPILRASATSMRPTPARPSSTSRRWLR